MAKIALLWEEIEAKMKKLSAPIFARPKNILDYCFQGVYRANINEKLCKKMNSHHWSGQMFWFS